MNQTVVMDFDDIRQGRIGTSIDEAARIIGDGGVCAFPTETGYGLGAAFDCDNALERIFSIKKRPYQKPLLIIVNRIEDAPIDENCINGLVRILMDEFWPGPLTLLLPAAEGASRFLTGDTGKIGVRMSSNEIARKLVQKVGRPITATSANLSGRNLPKDVQEAVRQLSDDPPDYFLDGGRIEAGPASTILDIASNEPYIVRKGAISEKDILAVVQRALDKDRL